MNSGLRFRDAFWEIHRFILKTMAGNAAAANASFQKYLNGELPEELLPSATLPLASMPVWPADFNYLAIIRRLRHSGRVGEAQVRRRLCLCVGRGADCGCHSHSRGNKIPARSLDGFVC